ncbi:MAG: hypothetical protein ACRC11_15565 [Xenococcaceae cyanobacterium]
MVHRAMGNGHRAMGNGHRASGIGQSHAFTHFEVTHSLINLLLFPYPLIPNP